MPFIAVAALIAAPVAAPVTTQADDKTAATLLLLTLAVPVASAPPISLLVQSALFLHSFQSHAASVFLTFLRMLLTY